MVTHFTSQLHGGAGIAALRLHLGLCRAAVTSQMYFGSGEPVDSTTLPAFQNRSFFWRNAVALAKSWRGRRQSKTGFVTSPRWVRKTPIQKLPRAPDLINLHWVAQWLDLPSFFNSLPAGLPVVWSLHDLIPVTGGCHYPGDCTAFATQCGNCPQQREPTAQDDTFQFFRIKQRCYAKANLHFVGNSAWTTAQIRRSGLAKYARSIHTIPLGLDPDQFKPVDKSCARHALGIPENRFVIGFACADLSEARKGAGLLLAALKSNALPAKDIFLLSFGAGHWPETSGIENLHLGSLNAPRLQSLFYSALDVFTTPSRSETFGNTAMEAMACGTPVAAYATSGLIDVVTDGETGLLEKEVASVPGLIRMLKWMKEHPVEMRDMGLAARKRVVQHFSDKLMAERYTKLYRELLGNQ